MAKKTHKKTTTKKTTAKKKDLKTIKKDPKITKKAVAKKAVKKTAKKTIATKKATEKTTKKAVETKKAVAKKAVKKTAKKTIATKKATEKTTKKAVETKKAVAKKAVEKKPLKKKKKTKAEMAIQKIGNDANRSLSKYLQEISQFDPLDPEREIELAIAVKQGSRRALKELTEANLRFVVSVAKDYQGQGLPLTDLINEGNLGLIKAAERFDESRGFKFISYAVWWIRQSVLQALAEHSRIVRLPLNRVGTISKINKASERLEQEFERSPRADEIAHQLDMRITEINDAQRIARRHHSLDTPFSDDEKNSLLDVISDTNIDDPDKELHMGSLEKEVRDSLDTLKEREKDVIKMYFGIDREYALTLNEIGEEFGLTRERVRQIKEKAIRRLRHRSRSRKLRTYLG
jgi:RNA polymerase primary sigma factor